MKKIEKMPPVVNGGNTELREICDYLIYLIEQINYLFDLQERKIKEIDKSEQEMIKKSQP